LNYIRVTILIIAHFQKKVKTFLKKIFLYFKHKGHSVYFSFGRLGVY